MCAALISPLAARLATPSVAPAGTADVVNAPARIAIRPSSVMTLRVCNPFPSLHPRWSWTDVDSAGPPCRGVWLLPPQGKTNDRVKPDGYVPPKFVEGRLRPPHAAVDL